MSPAKYGAYACRGIASWQREFTVCFAVRGFECAIKRLRSPPRPPEFRRARWLKAARKSKLRGAVV